MTKMKEITTTTATIDFGDWRITATGRLDEFYDWEIATSYNNIFAPTRSWTSHEYFSSEDDLAEFLWDEVQRLNQKYSVCVFDHMLEEVEDEDED
jgi:hypothetical protein